MISTERLTSFSLSSAVTYTLAYYFNWPLFRYYPIANQVSWHDQPSDAGSAILWYGWLATACLAGIVIALVIPRGWVKRMWDDVRWSVPMGLLVAVLIFEMRWFVK